jgi:hypothetical protein
LWCAVYWWNTIGLSAAMMAASSGEFKAATPVWLRVL